MTEKVGGDVDGLSSGIHKKGGLVGVYSDAIMAGRLSGAKQIKELIDAGTDPDVLRQIFDSCVKDRQEFPNLAENDPVKMHLAAQNALLVGQRTGVIQVHCEASNMLVVPDGNIAKVREFVENILDGVDII